MNNTKSQRITQLLSLAFFFSGMSALIYQVVWQRLLTTYYGVGPISFTLIVTIFMIGLGFGSLFGGYLAEKLQHKILAVFFIESSIGIFGIISPIFLAYLGHHTAGSSYILSFIYMFIFLSFPTFLMGCTLPMLTKIFSALNNDFLKSVSLLYFINTIGAAIGTLVASYWIISFFGLDTAIFIAAAINFTIALLILFTIRSVSKTSESVSILLSLEKKAANLVTPSIKTKYLLFLICITGFIAIGYEIIWFRVVGVLVKDSPYAFSSVLAIYLTGIAIGSLMMNGFLKRNKSLDIVSLFFAIQFLIGLSVSVTFIGYFYLTQYTELAFFTSSSFLTDLHPYFTPLANIKTSKEFLIAIYQLFDVFLWSAVFVLIPTILMGASFPLVSVLALSNHNQEGKTISIVYFFTIVGNALGGVLTGFILLPYLGTENTLVIFSSIGIIFAIFVSRIGRIYFSLLTRSVIVFSLIVVNLIAFPDKTELYKVMHTINNNLGWDSYIEEGIDGVIVTHQQNKYLRNFINGSSHGGRPIYLFNYETIEAMAKTPKLEKVLVIGYGTGTIVETLLKSNEVGEVVVVELNKTLLTNLRKMPLFNNMLNDHRIRLIVDDGRRYLLRTTEKFDLVTIDSLRTTTAYSNNLYSADFYQLVHEHLKPKGVFLTWRDEDSVIPKTLASEFEYLEMHKDFCLGSNAPFEINNLRRQELIDRFSPTEQPLLLANAGYLGDKSYVQGISKNYPINNDWKPWAEYYIGLKFK